MRGGCSSMQKPEWKELINILLDRWKDKKMYAEPQRFNKIIQDVHTTEKVSGFNQVNNRCFSLYIQREWR